MVCFPVHISNSYCSFYIYYLLSGWPHYSRPITFPQIKTHTQPSRRPPTVAGHQSLHHSRCFPSSSLCCSGCLRARQNNWSPPAGPAPTPHAASHCPVHACNAAEGKLVDSSTADHLLQWRGEKLQSVAEAGRSGFPRHHECFRSVVFKLFRLR